MFLSVVDLVEPGPCVYTQCLQSALFIPRSMSRVLIIIRRSDDSELISQVYPLSSQVALFLGVADVATHKNFGGGAGG